MRAARTLGLAALVLAAGCADAEEKFREGRLLDACDQSWPVCTTTAGCLADSHSYLEGRFPGTRRLAVRTEGRAEIAVAIFLRTQGAPGTETRLEWSEAGCGASGVETVSGVDLFKEMEAEGEYRRARSVQLAGDHLIEITSDATADYLIKVDVHP